MADKSSIEIGGDYEELERALGESEALFEDFGEHITDTAKSVDASWSGVGESIKDMAGMVSAVWTTVSGHIAQQFDDIWYRIKKGTQAFIELTAEVTKLGGVFRTMGTNVGFTLKGLEQMNDQMKNLSVNSSEAIRSAQMTLMEFKNVRGDVFKDAIKSAMDFAAVTSGSLSSAIQHYGRLLNDPIKGLTELAEDGVEFSASQTKLIEKLLEANDVIGLQKVLLAKLSEIYGGEAKRQANSLWGALERLNNIFTDMWTNIGSLLAPTLVNKFIPIMEKVAKVVKAVVSYLDDNGEAMGKAFDRAMEVAKEWSIVLMDVGVKTFAVLHTAVMNWDLTWRTVWLGMQHTAVKTLAYVLERAQELGQFMGRLWDQAKAALRPFIDMAKAGIGVIVESFKLVGQIASSIWDGIVSAAKWAWDTIGQRIMDWSLAAIGAGFLAYHFFVGLFKTIGEVGPVVFEALSMAAKAMWDQLTLGTRLAIDILVSGFKLVYTVVSAVFTGVWTVGKVVIDAVVHSWTAGLKLIASLFGLVGEGIGAMFSNAMQVIKLMLNGFMQMFSGIGNGADSVFGKIFKYLKALGFAIMDNLFGDVKIAMNPAIKALDDMGKKFDDAKAKAAAAAAGIKDKFNAAFAQFKNMPGIDQVIDQLKKRAGELGGDFDKAFGEFKDKFAGNLAADNKVFDDWKQKIKDIIDSRQDIEETPFFEPKLKGDKDKDKNKRDTGNVFEDLRDFRRRIEEAAAKSPEAEATDKQSDLMRALHAEDKDQRRELINAVKNVKPFSEKKNLVHHVRIFDVVNGFDGGGM